MIRRGGTGGKSQKKCFRCRLQWVSLEWYLGSARTRLAPS
jgi:hypothetical protein